MCRLRLPDHAEITFAVDAVTSRYWQCAGSVGTCADRGASVVYTAGALIMCLPTSPTDVGNSHPAQQQGGWLRWQCRWQCGRQAGGVSSLSCVRQAQHCLQLLLLLVMMQAYADAGIHVLLLSQASALVEAAPDVANALATSFAPMP